MANVIGDKRHLFVYVQTPKGIKKHEVKFDSSNYKLKEKLDKHIQQEAHRQGIK